MPEEVTIDNKTRQLFGNYVQAPTVEKSYNINSGTTFVPNYLQYPAVNYKVDLNEKKPSPPSEKHIESTEIEGKILKIRVANLTDQDFIEIDLPKTNLTFNDLKRIMCEELNISAETVERLRKLPNTKLRRDIDVQRLTDYEEIELVLFVN